MPSHSPLLRRAVAALLPLALAGHAHAACVVPTGTLTNVDAGATVTCDGATTGQTIASVNGGVQVVVNSGTLSNSSVDLAGADSQFAVLSGATATGVTVAVRGATGSIVVDSNATLNTAPGGVVMGNTGAPTVGTVTVLGTVATASPTPFALLSGLDGSQTFRVEGTLGTPSGRFISAGAGDDYVELFDTTRLLGGSTNGRIIDGGAGSDTLSWSSLGGTTTQLFVNTVGVETLLVGADLALDGTHEFTRVEVDGGATLSVSNIASLGSANATIALQSAGTLRLDLSNLVAPTLTQNLAGSGTLELTGIGRATLAGDNSAFAGTLRVAPSSNGVGISGANQLGTATLEVNGLARFNGASDYAFLNTIRGTGNLFLDGSGTVTFGTGNVDFRGNVFVNAGTLVIGGSQSVGTGQLTIETDATLRIDNGAQDSVLSTVLFGNGVIVKRGTGVTTLTGSSAFDGAARIEEGGLRVNDLTQLGFRVPTDVAAGASLILDYTDPVASVVTTLMTGAGRFVKEGDGTVVVDAANSYTGGTVIRAGRLGLNDGDGLGSGAIQVDSGAILGIGGVTLGNVVTGTGQIIKTANNVATLTGANGGFTGALRVNEGTVAVQNVTALGAGSVNVATGATVSIDNATDQTFSTSLFGSGDLVKSGAGRLVIDGTNAFVGNIAIAAGTVQVDGSGASGFGNIDIAAGATLNLQNQNGRAINNTLSGAGRVVKTGAGFTTIANGGAYTGGTELLGGGLRVTNLAALGTGPITSAAGTTLVLSHAGTSPQVVTSIMTGAGGFQKEGAGTVVVNASNTYTGGTVIAEGRLGLNFGDALGTGAIQVNSGAILGIGNITLANAVQGAGRIIKTAADVATLTGNNVGFTGELAIQQGTVSVASASALGTGSVNVDAGATLRYSNATTATFANSLAGAGTFSKQGAGRLDFVNPFAIGALDVAAGRVRVNAVATTNATVAAGATLDGTGRIVGNLVNRGTVAPGNSIGTLTVQGNYVHEAGSVLEVEFDAAGNIDLLSVTGTATLNGGTLRFVSLGGAEGTGGTFLTAAGGLTGTFATVETVGAQLPLAVIYQSGSALMAPSVVTARPSTFNAQLLAASETAFGYLDQVADAPRWAGGDQVWFQGFGARGERDAADASLGYRHDSWGFATGAVWPLSKHVSAGVSAGWATGDVRLDSNGGGGEQRSLLGAVHLDYARDGYRVGGGLLIGRVDQSTVRNVSFSGFAARIDGDTDSKLVGGFVTASAPVADVGRWSIDVSGRASSVRQSQDAYAENGTSPLRLSVADLNATTLELEALLTATRRFGDAHGPRLRFDLGARRQSLQGDRAIDVRFAASNAPVTLQGDRRDTTQAVVGASFLWPLTERVLLSAVYAGQLGGQDRHEARLGLSLGF
jgi:autotransporter-associated beta strand protein